MSLETIDSVANSTQFFSQLIEKIGGQHVNLFSIYNIAKTIKITDFKVYGNMTAQSGSSITLNCSVSEKYDVDLKWFLGDNDVTEKSKGLSTYLKKTSSELQVNFTSVSDIKSTYKCEKFGDFQLKCTMPVTCRAEREFANGDRRDHLVEVVIGKQFLP